MLKNLDFIKVAHIYGWSLTPDYSKENSIYFEFPALKHSPKVQISTHEPYLTAFSKFKESFDFDKSVVEAWKCAKGKKPSLNEVIKQVTVFMTEFEKLEDAATVVGDVSRRKWMKDVYGLSFEEQVKRYKNRK